jgi:hypothetical protein
MLQSRVREGDRKKGSLFFRQANGANHLLPHIPPYVGPALLPVSVPPPLFNSATPGAAPGRGRQFGPVVPAKSSNSYIPMLSTPLGAGR